MVSCACWLEVVVCCWLYCYFSCASCVLCVFVTGGCCDFRIVDAFFVSVVVRVGVIWCPCFVFCLHRVGR